PPAPPAPIAVAPPVDPPLVQIIRAYLDNRPDVAAALIRTLDPASQDLLFQLVPAVVQASQLTPGKPHEVGGLVKQLDAAVASLAPKAPLMIEKVCFCEEFTTFGKYKPL